MNPNRSKGIRFELKIMHELIALGFKALTSRNESKTLDAQKVDLVSNFPFFIQCKNTERLPNPWDIFNAMPKDKPPCIFWTKNHKEDLVILNKKDFYKLIK